MIVSSTIESALLLLINSSFNLSKPMVSSKVKADVKCFGSLNITIEFFSFEREFRDSVQLESIVLQPLPEGFRVASEVSCYPFHMLLVVSPSQVSNCYSRLCTVPVSCQCISSSA